MQPEIIVLQPIFGKSFTGEPIESYGSIMNITLNDDDFSFRGKYAYKEDGKEVYVNEISYTSKAQITKVSLSYDNEDELYFIEIIAGNSSEVWNVPDDQGLAIFTQIQNWWRRKQVATSPSIIPTNGR